MSFLNPSLERSRICHELQTRSRVLIKDALQPQFAEALRTSVQQQSNWEQVFLVDANNPPRRVPVDPARAVPAQQQAEIDQQILAQARNGYQFSYHRYSILEAVLRGMDENNFMHTFLHYLNSQEFIEFTHDITGDRQIRKCDAQACWYAPGQFLRLHQDKNPVGEDRRYAYVMGLTKSWQSDWGGQLQFVSEGEITETFTPSFNVLTIFKVPQDHQVSVVAPYATAPRLTVTGWMRAD